MTTQPGDSIDDLSTTACWLSAKNRAIAEALIQKADFIYCGREEDFIPYDDTTIKPLHLRELLTYYQRRKVGLLT